MCSETAMTQRKPRSRARKHHSMSIASIKKSARNAPIRLQPSTLTSEPDEITNRVSFRSEGKSRGRRGDGGALYARPVAGSLGAGPMMTISLSIPPARSKLLANRAGIPGATRLSWSNKRIRSQPFSLALCTASLYARPRPTFCPVPRIVTSVAPAAAKHFSSKLGVTGLFRNSWTSCTLVEMARMSGMAAVSSG